MSKVSIIGAGEVGASCATCLADRDFVNEIVIVDVKPGLAEGKALDLRQSAALKRFDTIVKGYTADYSTTANSDVVVITSGITRKPGMERSDLIATNAGIVKEVTQQVAKYSPNSVIVVVSNPLDVLCYCVWKNSGFPSNRVMGMSGQLDVARYKSFIAEALNVSTKDIQALILGGHGKSMVPMPRYTTIGGIPIRNLLSEEKVQEAIHRTQLGGEEIINYLGRSGWYAAGAAVCEMVEAVICDQRRVFTACAYLDGEYGYKDIYLGVPVILGKNGIERIIELELDPDDKIRFDESQKEVDKTLKLIKSIMANKRIYLCLAHMSDAGLEQKYIQEAFDTNWVVPLGPNVNGFEKDLEEFCGQDKRVVALSAGTAAVHLGLLACGVGPGDEVCVQSFTFCASSHPITYLGATPVFIDSEKETWNMDSELLEEAIKDRIAKTGKKPKAIVPVALYGMPYKIDRIMEIANKYEIPVVEDAAEGFGSRFNGQVLGTFGKYGVLSFNGNKMITTSGGGALITANEDEWREIMMYATQYRESYPYYQHEKIGYNYRMSNICAGIGRGQMTVVNDHIAHHKHVQKIYEEMLKDVKGVSVHSQPATGEYDSNYWLCTITLDPNVKIKGQENAYKTIVKGAVGGAAGVIHVADSATTDCQPNENVEALRVFMDAAGIEARPVWKPMHKQPVYKNAPAYVNGVSEAVFKVGMCLPAGPYVKDEDVKFIVDTIKNAIE